MTPLWSGVNEPHLGVIQESQGTVRRWVLTPLGVSQAGLVMSLEVLDVSFLEKLKTALKGLSHTRLLLGALAGPLALQGRVGSCPPRRCHAFKVGFFFYVIVLNN